MTHQLFHLPKSTQIDSSVRVTPGAKAYFYATTTSTPQDTYTTSALNVAHANPVVADANGVFASIYLDPSLLYKLTLTTSADVLIYTQDPVNDSLLSADSIGQYLYPETAAEAGVTILDYQYPPGNVLRYYSGTGSIATAWAAADTQSAAGGAPIYLPRRDYETATALTANALSDIHFELGANITYTGSSDIAVLTIGDSAANQVCFSRRYENLWVERQSQSDWNLESNIGIRVYNAAGCYFSIAQISGFTIGFQAMPSNGAGFQGNELHFGHIYNCKYARDWSNATGGFCNDNTSYSGRIQAFSTVASHGARFGDRITSTDQVYFENNGNRFYGTLIELDATGAAGEAVAVLVEYGEENLWHNIRSEWNDLTMRCTNSSHRNEVWLGYSDDATTALEQLLDASENVVIPMRERPKTHYSYEVANFTDLGRKAKGTSGTSILVEGLTWGHSSLSTPTGVSNTGVTYDGNYITIPTTRAMGIYVDASAVKEFVVRRTGTAGGRVIVIPYDSGGSVLSAARSVVGQDNAGFTYNGATFGGAWQTNSDFLFDSYFRVSSSTSYVWVGIVGGSASAAISSFGIYSRPKTGVRAYTNMYTTLGEITGGAWTTGAHATLRDFTGTTTAAQALQLLETLVDDLKTTRQLR